MAAIKHSMYKDQKAITFETEILCAQFLPERGAKLASLIYKPRRWELLVQRPDPIYAVQPFDGDYVSAECSGLDDMFPTIDTCYYDRYPWQGTKMADHGEVWSLPWETKLEDNEIHFAVNGIRFPYRLEKRVSFAGENILRWDYLLLNLSPFDFDFLWAAHPMFNLEDGAELILPEGVNHIAGTFSIPPGYLTYGDEFNYPIDSSSDEVERDFRKLQPKSACLAYKYFIKGKLPEGWCGVKYHQSDFSLYMSFPVEQVPYLGILPNAGGWQDLYNIFLEPCTAPFDRPDAARYRGQVSTLKGSSQVRWHLNITLAEGTTYRCAREDGNLEA
jgi:galactose mutarotase-like enzyme